MGVYDFVVFDRDVELPGFHPGEKPWRHSWQTRAFSDRAYRMHCITGDGHLYRVDHTYEPNGLVDGDPEDPETGNAFALCDFIKQDEYDGNPLEEFPCDWHRVRYLGTMRVTCQGRNTSVRCDVDFDRHDINEIEQVHLD